MRKKISVLLVDDHALVRRGLRRLLEDEPSIDVIGEARDGVEAVRMTGELEPAVVLMDFALPGMNGVDATRKIVESGSNSAVIMLSMHTDPRRCLVACGPNFAQRFGHQFSCHSQRRLGTPWNWTGAVQSSRAALPLRM